VAITFISSLKGDSLINVEHLRKITNMDKVTLALLLEEGKARITELEFHLNLTKRQINSALTRMVAQGMVMYEVSTASYMLL
jgi:predicted transcriptional regulator